MCRCPVRYHWAPRRSNAIDVPLDDGAVGTTVVGAPHLTFDYSGIGTSRSVYAQIVDTNTGLVVGNIVTPIPVTLDGRPHIGDINMADIVYTYDDVPNDADLELQIVGSATQFLNLTQFGFINVSDVAVSLPTPGSRADVTEETLRPGHGVTGRTSGCQLRRGNRQPMVLVSRYCWKPSMPHCRPTPLFL